MKTLACQIACYTSLFFLIFSCEDPTEADMSSKLSSTLEYPEANSSASSGKTIWFTFNKAKLPDGKYKVGKNPLTSSKLFITLKKNEVAEVHIKTIGGFVIELDPVPFHGKDGLNPAEFMCLEPNSFTIFEGHTDPTRPTKLLAKYTIYVVRKDCNPKSHVMQISMDKNY